MPPVRHFTLNRAARKKPVTVCMDAVSVTGLVKTDASLFSLFSRNSAPFRLPGCLGKAARLVRLYPGLKLLPVRTHINENRAALTNVSAEDKFCRHGLHIFLDIPF